MILSITIFPFVLAKTVYQLNPCIVGSGNTEASACDYIDILQGFNSTGLTPIANIPEWEAGRYYWITTINGSKYTICKNQKWNICLPDHFSNKTLMLSQIDKLVARHNEIFESSGKVKNPIPSDVTFRGTKALPPDLPKPTQSIASAPSVPEWAGFQNDLVRFLPSKTNQT